MDVRVRDATLADFERIVELFWQLWPGKALDRKKLLIVFNQKKTSDVYGMLCAEDDGKVVGFCSTATLQNFWQEGPILYITTMIVDEQFRKQNVGTALIRAVVDIARECGCRRIDLESAFHRNDAHAFYEKMGFEKRAFFYSRAVQY